MERLKTINKLALAITQEVNGLLRGMETEPTLYKKAMRIARLSK